MRWIATIALVFVTGLAGCDYFRGNSEAPRSSTRSYQYRVASIEREVVDLEYSRSRSVSFSGRIEFTQTEDIDQGPVLLFARMRTETDAGTDETEIMVLMEGGRGEYEGSFRYLSGLPLDQAAPELRTEQVTVSILGVVPLDAATLTGVLPAAPERPSEQTQQ